MNDQKHQPLNSRVAVVTGSSRGIGKAIAQRFVRQGATILGTATTKESAEKMTSELDGKGTGLVLNLSDKK